VPAAPRLLGRALGDAVALGLLGVEEVATQAAAAESAEPRRTFVAAALSAVKVRTARLPAAGLLCQLLLAGWTGARWRSPGEGGGGGALSGWQLALNATLWGSALWGSALSAALCHAV
jgi:hypothetical protein